MTNKSFIKISEEIKQILPSSYAHDYQIILASASPRRKDLLLQIEENIGVEAINYNENNNLVCPLGEVSLALAFSKAKQFIEQVPLLASRFILTADTIVYHTNPEIILGKPKSVIKAKEMLRYHLGKTHTVSSAFVLVDLLKKQIHYASDHCEISFFPENVRLIEIIEEYTRLKPPLGPMDKAGAYGYQEEIIRDNFIKSISGDPTTIIGFPMEKFKRVWIGLG